MGSLGVEEERAAFLELPSKLSTLRYVGFGVTEAGLTKDSQAMLDLSEFLYQAFLSIPGASSHSLNEFHGGLEY